MRNLLITIIFLFNLISLNAQSDIIGGSGICLTDTIPTFVKNTLDCPLAYDVNTNQMYSYTDSGWVAFNPLSFGGIFELSNDSNLIAIEKAILPGGTGNFLSFRNNGLIIEDNSDSIKIMPNSLNWKFGSSTQSIDATSYALNLLNAGVGFNEFIVTDATLNVGTNYSSYNYGYYVSSNLPNLNFFGLLYEDDNPDFNNGIIFSLDDDNTFFRIENTRNGGTSVGSMSSLSNTFAIETKDEFSINFNTDQSIGIFTLNNAASILNVDSFTVNGVNLPYFTPPDTALWFIDQFGNGFFASVDSSKAIFTDGNGLYSGSGNLALDAIISGDFGEDVIFDLNTALFAVYNSSATDSSFIEINNTPNWDVHLQSTDRIILESDLLLVGKTTALTYPTLAPLQDQSLWGFNINGSGNYLTPDSLSNLIAKNENFYSTFFDVFGDSIANFITSDTSFYNSFITNYGDSISQYIAGDEVFYNNFITNFGDSISQYIAGNDIFYSNFITNYGDSISLYVAGDTSFYVEFLTTFGDLISTYIGGNQEFYNTFETTFGDSIFNYVLNNPNFYDIFETNYGDSIAIFVGGNQNFYNTFISTFGDSISNYIGGNQNFYDNFTTNFGDSIINLVESNISLGGGIYGGSDTLPESVTITFNNADVLELDASGVSGGEFTLNNVDFNILSNAIMDIDGNATFTGNNTTFNGTNTQFTGFITAFNGDVIVGELQQYYDLRIGERIGAGYENDYYKIRIGVDGSNYKYEWYLPENALDSAKLTHTNFVINMNAETGSGGNLIMNADSLIQLASNSISILPTSSLEFGDISYPFASPPFDSALIMIDADGSSQLLDLPVFLEENVATIYTNDGVLTDDRVIDGQLNSLTLDNVFNFNMIGGNIRFGGPLGNISSFFVRSSGNIDLTSTNGDFELFLGSNVNNDPRIFIEENPASSNESFVQTGTIRFKQLGNGDGIYFDLNSAQNQKLSFYDNGVFQFSSLYTAPSSNNSLQVTNTNGTTTWQPYKTYDDLIPQNKTSSGGTLSPDAEDFYYVTFHHDLNSSSTLTINALTNLKDGGEYLFRIYDINGSVDVTWNTLFKDANGADLGTKTYITARVIPCLYIQSQGALICED
jgi:hypothetical protein